MFGPVELPMERHATVDVSHRNKGDAMRGLETSEGPLSPASRRGRRQGRRELLVTHRRVPCQSFALRPVDRPHDRKLILKAERSVGCSRLSEMLRRDRT